MNHAFRVVRPADIDEAEWAARLELAACYRVFHHLGWIENIFNHITLRVPGPEHHALINPFGLLYSEVTASNLIRIDLDGRAVRPSPYPVNVAGFVIHGAIHRHRDDAHCIMHTHTTAGMAVACKDEGLRTDNFNSAQLYGRVAYHDFEGITTDLAEQPRLVTSLGDKEVLIMRNHGLLVTGPHLPAAFATMWCLQRACEVQLAADSMRGANRAVPQSVLEAIPRQAQPFRGGDGTPAGGPRRGRELRRPGLNNSHAIDHSAPGGTVRSKYRRPGAGRGPARLPGAGRGPARLPGAGRGPARLPGAGRGPEA